MYELVLRKFLPYNLPPWKDERQGGWSGGGVGVTSVGQLSNVVNQAVAAAVTNE